MSTAKVSTWSDVGPRLKDRQSKMKSARSMKKNLLQTGSGEEDDMDEDNVLVCKKWDDMTSGERYEALLRRWMRTSRQTWIRRVNKMKDSAPNNTTSSTKAQKNDPSTIKEIPKDGTTSSTDAQQNNPSTIEEIPIDDTILSNDQGNPSPSSVLPLAYVTNHGNVFLKDVEVGSEYDVFISTKRSPTPTP